MHAFLGLFLMILFSSFQGEKTVWLLSLALTKMVQEWGKPVIDINIKSKKPLSIGKQVFEKGVGTRVKGYVWINLAGGSERFMAYAGVDNDTSYRSIEGLHLFKIYGDEKLLWQPEPVKYGEGAKKIEINVRGIKTLILEVINIGKNNSNLQLDWADARFIVNGQNPVAITPHVKLK